MTNFLLLSEGHLGSIQSKCGSESGCGSGGDGAEGFGDGSDPEIGGIGDGFYISWKDTLEDSAPEQDPDAVYGRNAEP